jgi:hypothetical protein
LRTGRDRRHERETGNQEPLSEAHALKDAPPIRGLTRRWVNRVGVIIL